MALAFAPCAPVTAARRRCAVAVLRPPNMRRRRCAHKVDARATGGIEEFLGDAQVAGDDQMRSIIGSLSDESKANAIVDALCKEGKLPVAKTMVQRMIDRGFKPARQTCTAMIDAAVIDGNAKQVAQVVRALAPALRRFGSLKLPPTKTLNPATLPVIPDEQQQVEIVAALSFLTLVVGSLSLEVVDPILNRPTIAPTLVLLGCGVGLYADYRTYGGKVFSTVRLGLQRLLADDPLRTSRVESANFLLAYVLGVPFMSYRPNLFAIVEELGKDAQREDVDRYAVWIMSGAASEANIDGRIVDSDSRAALKLFAALDKNVKKSCGLASLKARNERLRWAYAQARSILNFYKSTQALLEKSMMAGASVGECVELLSTQK